MLAKPWLALGLALAGPWPGRWLAWLAFGLAIAGSRKPLSGPRHVW